MYSNIQRGFFENNGWRELKETQSNNWKIPRRAIMFGVSEKRPSSNSKFYLPITFGVSEKRLHGLILDEMRSDTPPR
ncbi:hypothetical protein T07_226 [Trichinella nelsoni]|uniref:Uncharacterized protein n=1 Tax=Trichinella nelsoni TaxID=6336 RepID=A0A0V0RCD5_9BILA|nr:hypothetical protein T07_226 [Trichinella nelsoni]